MKKLWLALTKINSPPHVSVPEEKQKTPDEIFTELIYKISGLEAKLYKIIIIKKKKIKSKIQRIKASSTPMILFNITTSYTVIQLYVTSNTGLCIS